VEEGSSLSASSSKEDSSKLPLDVLGLFPQVRLISDDVLRGAVVATWQDLWAESPWTDIHTVPTSVAIPYPTIPHNQAILTMALAIADAFEAHHKVVVNRDRLIAAAVLQDASKLVEFAPGPDGVVAPTEIGKTYPHAFWGAHVALRNGVPDDVVHIILTHTPHATKFPRSIEGKILYHVDQIDVIAIHGDRWRKNLYITK
jgi:hypothetical protein